MANDVAKILGYKRPADAISIHCRGSVKHRVTDITGRQQLTSIIPERDVYRLIMRSKLPAAEKFEDWVVDVVLPTIRKTGGYVASDIAKIWGYSDTINAIKRHCRGVAKRHLPHPQSPEKTINVSIIPERDVYRLIMRSKLLAAEKFEDWITLVITNNQD